ncbi:MAG: hypothetical protein PF450_04190 [Bacteroidales bacterium]|nr:hypothetical protein [Bacteroidales bacterium]
MYSKDDITVYANDIITEESEEIELDASVCNIELINKLVEVIELIEKEDIEYSRLDINEKVEVRSGELIFQSTVDDVKWDSDQWSYHINGNWYCQSEVTEL